MFSGRGLPGLWCLLVNPQGLMPGVHHLLPPAFTQNQERATQSPGTKLKGSLFTQISRKGDWVDFPVTSPKLSRLIESGGPPTCVTQSSSGWVAGPRLHMDVSCTFLTRPFNSPPALAVPSQPPENVRALSITSDVAVISWSEPPRSTLNGVLKGYRVIFWSLYVDGGESAGSGGQLVEREARGRWRSILRVEHVHGMSSGSPAPPPYLSSRGQSRGQGGWGTHSHLPGGDGHQLLLDSSMLGSDLRGETGTFAFLMECVDIRTLWPCQSGDSWRAQTGQLRRL